MFSSSIHHLPSVGSYASAHAIFTKTAKPFTRSGQWHDNQRPLKDTRSHHYRLEQGPDAEYYDVMLYRTAMARFYAPTPEGRREMYISHDSNMSKQFMRSVTHHSNFMTMRSTDLLEVAVPIPNMHTIHDKGTGFSASLWFDPLNRLDVDKSAHTPMFTHRTNPADKALVQQVRERCEPYITLACMRLPEFASNMFINQELLVPFKGGVEVLFSGRMAIRRMTDGDEVGQEFINAFMTLAEKVYDYEATKLSFKQGALTGDDIAQHVTEKVLADGLWRVIVRETPQLRRKSEAVPLPQFMAAGKYPKTTATPHR